ncbi:unnamed protein product [Lactuca virosa]|uniref:Uncharacterized protein n=1 Tax=Lactuca virosa TaxID=75947 RepID=A0AAU9LIR4_9ASTR|nr:unnamed protein product [Lactuca virosa]
MPGRPTVKRKRDAIENNGRTQTKKKKSSTVTNATKKVTTIEGQEQEEIQVTQFEVQVTPTQVQEDVQVQEDLFNEVQAKEDNVRNVQVQELNDVNVQVQELNGANVQIQEVPLVLYTSDLLKRIKERKSDRILKLKLGKIVGDAYAPGNSKEKALHIE